MAKTPATAKTPTVAIARVLRGLGLKQGTDFSVSGEYRQSTGGYGRERIGTFVTLYTTLANETVAEHADAIETATEADGGWSFDVSIRYGKRSGNVFCDIANFGERIREAAPVADLKISNVKDAELRAAAVAMAAPVAEAPAAGETTKEEKVAAVAKRFPRGTRVQGVDSYGVTCAGTVDGIDYGMVTDTNHTSNRERGTLMIEITDVHSTSRVRTIVKVSGTPEVKATYLTRQIQPHTVVFEYIYRPEQQDGWTVHTWAVSHIKVEGWRVLKPGKDGSQRLGTDTHDAYWDVYLNGPLRGDGEVPEWLLMLADELRPAGDLTLS